MPTKTEQSDLLMALYGRHGESPLPVIAPSDARRLLRRRVRGGAIAIRYRTPVILLSDTFLASSSEPWRVPPVDDLRRDRPGVRRRARRTARSSCPTPATSGWRGRGRCRARPASRTGSAASRRPTAPATSPTTRANHARMTELRAAKVAGIARRAPAARGRRRPDAPAARARLGLERGRDPRRRAPRAAGRAQGRVRAPAPPQSAAGEHRRRAALVRARARARDEHRPARAGAAGEVPRRRRVVLQGSRASRCSPARSSSRSWSDYERGR